MAYHAACSSNFLFPMAEGWAYFFESKCRIKILSRLKHTTLLYNKQHCLTLVLLTWTIWRAPTNASKWRMGFNSAFKGLIAITSTVKPVMLVTLVSWPSVTAGHASIERKNRYDIINGRHLATCLSWILATIPHLALCFICTFNLPMLADLNVCDLLVSYCLRTEFLIHCRTTSCLITLYNFSAKHEQKTAISWWQLTH